MRKKYSRIPRLRKRNHLPADSLVGAVDNEGSLKTIVRVTVYDANAMEELVCKPEGVNAFSKDGRVLWVDVEGLGDHKAVEVVASQFKVHSLVVEDILHAHQRAKLEEYGKQFFLVTHMVTDHDVIEAKELSLVFNENWVLSFHDQPMEALSDTRARIANNQSAIRSHKADFLTYTLIDAVIDSYFPVLERLGERLEDLEDLVIANPNRESIGQIHIIKRELLILRRAVWPMRDAINALLRDGTSLLGEEARLHLRDCYDHAVRVLDFIETYREVGADLMDVYLSSVSNRLNEVMKMLTIITTIFAPSTFIAAIYGMNFDRSVSPYNMPETRWYYGYPIVLSAMLMATLGILLFLWWKGWLGVLALKGRGNGAGR